MKKYKILHGSFVLGPGVTAHQGEVIELEDDVASAHASSLELVQAPAPEALPAIDAPNDAPSGE